MPGCNLMQGTKSTMPHAFTPDMPDAEVAYLPGIFGIKESDRYLKTLIATIDWRQNLIRMYGRESPVPRLEAWHGDAGKSYTYSGITQEPQPWTPELLEIKRRVEPVAGVNFNSVLINHYRTGADRVGWHSDDEELGKCPVIGSVSLGSERKLKFRHRQYRENGLREEILLEHGSLLVMRGETQHHWMHQIPRTACKVGPRINLTFRVIH